MLSRDLDLLRVGAVVPALRVADVDFNVGNIIEAMYLKPSEATDTKLDNIKKE